jgi:hypothetical protein
MTLLSRLTTRAFGLPQAETYRIACDRDLKIMMPDGVVLLADRFYPRDLGARPTVIVSSVYADRTRGRFVSEFMAAQGFSVLVVSGRGAQGSGGDLDPFRQERADGLAVLGWAETQPWYTGQVGTTGASYRGYVQWATAAGASERLAAMSTQLIGSDLRSLLYPGGAFALELWLFWTGTIHAQEGSIWRSLLSAFDLGGKRAEAVRHLPLIEADEVAYGCSYRFWNEWLTHEEADDPYWDQGNHHAAIPQVGTPNHFVSGWFDFFVGHLVRDYAALVAAGQTPWLTIGPWSHFDTKVAAVGAREGAAWLRAHLLDDPSQVREAPVRIYVMGAEVWRDLEVFPPPGTRSTRWHLQPGGALDLSVPSPSEPESLRYDPATPTPAVGGAGRGRPWRRLRVDNRSHEARDDVLTYTSAPLPADLEVIGMIDAEVFVHAEVEHLDIFVRLCDVQPSGRSMNVCDGLQRLFPGRPTADAYGVRRVRVQLTPTAYRFGRGHRLRVQIAGGAFPRWARNTGTNEPLATATSLVPVERSIHHDPNYPSAVLLPEQQPRPTRAQR